MTKTRWLIIGAVSSLLLVAVIAVLLWPSSETADPCAGSRCTSIAAGEPIFLGSLLSDDATSGIDSLTSSELAIDYLDGRFDGIAGRLLDHPISLISENDDCTPEGGRLGAERLLEEEKLLGVIGTTCSSSALDEADALMTARKTLIVSPSNSAPSLTDAERHQRYYFRTALNDLLQGEVAAEFAYNKINGRKAAVMFSPSAYSSQLGDAFGNRFRLRGGIVASRTDIEAKGGVSAAVKAAERKKADVVFVPVQMSSKPSCADVVEAVRSSRALRSAWIIVSEACQDRTFLEALGKRADGVYASGPDAGDTADDPFYRSEYLPAFKRSAGAPPAGVFDTNAFDAINLIFGAVRQAAQRQPGGGLLIDREKLRSALLDVKGYSGLSGTLDCSTTGDCAQGGRIAIYEAPNWPVSRPGAEPVFSQSKSIAELLTGP
ncbi:MAG: branched-chain amino acid ABC transporter substrate-binding protein [Solirubrobacteraceae bacterium]|jgi:branched-chain amino acid transport system substrate-binding protein|nr:branched-chain amino acid ABC transporter substrate-binding protein [Solirubrobacteraceae bacterium]